MSSIELKDLSKEQLLSLKEQIDIKLQEPECNNCGYEDNGTIIIENKYKKEAEYYKQQFQDSLLEIHSLYNIEIMFKDLQRQHRMLCDMYEKATWNKCANNGIEHPSNWTKEEWDSACVGLGYKG